jgi:RHS repeat-associated protein
VTRDSDSALIAVYSYDALGRRIEKVVTNSDGLNGTTAYYLDGWQEIEEHNAADAATQQYVYGSSIDEQLIVDTNLTGTPRRLFYYQNALGSVYALTDTSSPAKIVEAYQYDAYGRQTVFSPGSGGSVVFGTGDVVTPGGISLVGNPFLFTGRRLDAETDSGGDSGLYYYRARYYDAIQGRFLQRDPAGPIDSINLYEYVGDSPSRLTDPLGLKSVTEWIELWEHYTVLSDERNARYILRFAWTCEQKTGKIDLESPSTGIVTYRDRGAKMETVPLMQEVDTHTKQVRFTGSASWKEWSLWGALGGGLAGAGTAGATVVAGSGGVAAVHPVGWVVVGVAGIGGGITGALIFRNEVTATFDVAWELKCVCQPNRVTWVEAGPREIHSNVNNSTGDLYWKNKTW